MNTPSPVPLVQGEPDRVLLRRLLIVAFAGVAMVLYVALPGIAAETTFQCVAWGSIVVFVRGLRRHGGITLPWCFIIAGWTSFAMGDLLFSVYEYVLDTSPFPSVADVFYLAGYPLLVAGFASLVRRSRPDGDRIALIDAGIVLVPAAVAAWIYLIGPYAASGTTMTERAVSGSYPLGDLLLLAVMLRLFSPGIADRRLARPALAILGISMFAMLGADAWFVCLQLRGSYVTGGWSDALYLFPYIGFAVAAMDPSVEHIGTHLPRTDPSLGRRRRTMLTLAAMVTPILLLVQYLTNSAMAVPLVVVATAVSFLLVIARLSTVVEALEESRNALVYDATHDHLTGLVNRGLFAERIDAAVGGCDEGSLLFVDLDNFKRINDRLGHRTGDLTLVDVSTRLRAAVRDGDVVARLGGDEFAVLLPGADGAITESLAARLVEELSIPVEDLLVTASIGSVSWSRDGGPTSASILLESADRAMYAAKADNGNCFVRYVPEHRRAGGRIDDRRGARGAGETPDAPVGREGTVQVAPSPAL